MICLYLDADVMCFTKGSYELVKDVLTHLGWKTGPDIGGGHICMSSTSKRAGEMLGQFGTTVFRNLAEHPDSLSNLEARDLPRGKKGEDGETSRIYIDSVNAQRLLCPARVEGGISPLFLLSSITRNANFRTTASLTSMPIGMFHHGHFDPRSLYGYLSQRGGPGGNNVFLNMLERALTEAGVFSYCVECIQQMAGASVFELRKVDLHAIDPNTLWLKKNASTGRSVQFIRLPGDSIAPNTMRYDPMRCDVIRWDGMGWDGMRCDVIRWNAMRCDAM